MIHHQLPRECGIESFSLMAVDGSILLDCFLLVEFVDLHPTRFPDGLFVHTYLFPSRSLSNPWLVVWLICGWSFPFQFLPWSFRDLYSFCIKCWHLCFINYMVVIPCMDWPKIPHRLIKVDMLFYSQGFCLSPAWVEFPSGISMCSLQSYLSRYLSPQQEVS